MTPSTDTAEQMKSVKAAWDKAPEGPKKEVALAHYQAAERARQDKNDDRIRSELDMATEVLS